MDAEYFFCVKQIPGRGCRRGGRPTTTIYGPSHILLSFSSEPPQNPRLFKNMLLSLQSLKILFENLSTLGNMLIYWIFFYKFKICEKMYMLPKRCSTNKHLSAVAIFRKLLWNSIKTAVSILTVYFHQNFLNDLITVWMHRVVTDKL